MQLDPSLHDDILTPMLHFTKKGEDMQARINCVFYSDFRKCTHLDMGFGFLGLGRDCVYEHKFVSGCHRQVKRRVARPSSPPPPPEEE